MSRGRSASFWAREELTRTVYGLLRQPAMITKVWNLQSEFDVGE